MSTTYKPTAHLPFYGNDFFQALEGYSDGVVIGYLRALWHYWHHCHCKGLPDDDEYLKRVCRSQDHNWARTKGIIFDGERFFRIQDGAWHQPRCLREYQHTQRVYEAKVSAAATARKYNPDNKPKPKPVNNPRNDLQPEPEPEPYSEAESESESEPRKSRTIRRFAPPSLKEVLLQGAKIGLPGDECDKFHAYYESNGWRVGRNPMKSWSAAMIHWRTNWLQRKGFDKPQPSLADKLFDKSIRSAEKDL